MLTFTKELHNHLCAESEAMEFKGKKKIQMQHQHFLGAVSAIDFLNQSEATCCPPSVYFSIMRGELILPKE